MWIRYPLPFASLGLGAECNGGGKRGSPTCCVESHLATWTRGDLKVCVCHTQTYCLFHGGYRWSPKTCSCDHKVYNGIRAGVNLGKLGVFSLIDRADSRAVPLRVRPFAVESSNLKSPGTRFPIAQRGWKDVLCWKCIPPFHSFPSSVPATLHVQLNRGKGRIIFSVKWKNNV